MPEIQARRSIPSEWGEQARCPACAAPDLAVQHQDSGPDQLRCTACGLRFELEEDGPHLRVTRWPDLHPTDSLPAPGAWLVIGELHALLKRSPPGVLPARATRLQSIEPLPANQPSPEAPPIDDLAARVKKLVDLGSTPMEIRASLARDGLPPERIQAALQASSRMARREGQLQTRKFLAWLVVLAILLPLAIWGGMRLEKFIAGHQDELVASLRATLVPNAVQALGVTTPEVRQQPTSGTIPACPGTPEQAAVLFGGQSGTWSPGPNGWIRIDASGEDVTILVPEGMLAAYFRIGEQMTLVEVAGPATIRNTPSLAISCP